MVFVPTSPFWQSICCYNPKFRMSSTPFTAHSSGYCVKAGAGWVMINLCELNSCPDWHKLVILLLDEMYIMEDLVPNKHSGKMVGFVDLGSVNNLLLAFEKEVEGSNDVQTPVLATSMMAIMVRGLFTPLRYPYAQFPC